MTGELWRGRRAKAWAAVLVVLMGAGLGTWATDTWPFAKDRARYCWGAWEEGSGPEFLSDTALDDGGTRTAEETAPTRQRPRGSCTVALRSEDSYGTEETAITVRYGPAPMDADDRMGWLVEHLGDRAMPLPDGLPGAVDGNQALLVLPTRCDTRDGRPTVVTLDSDAELASANRSIPTSAGLGGARSVAALAVAAANRGMKAADCAPERPLRITSPVLTLAEDTERVFTSRACRIRGIDFDEDATARMEYQVGAVTRELQSCSVRTSGLDGKPVLDALMIAEPRLNTLLDGAVGHAPPARGWRGRGTLGATQQVLRADCAGHPTNFLLRTPATSDLGKAKTIHYFASFTNAVTQRLGCAPAAPVASSAEATNADATNGGTGR